MIPEFKPTASPVTISLPGGISITCAPDQIGEAIRQANINTPKPGHEFIGIIGDTMYIRTTPVTRHP